MPLTFAEIGEEVLIQRISGTKEMKQHLADMGFVVGGKVIPVSKIHGSLIVNVKESRIAIGEDMARHIMI